MPFRAAGTVERDRAEPSWAAAAQLIQESSFVLLFRQLQLERDVWGVPTDETLAAQLSLVEGHPFQAYVESYTGDRSQAQRALTRLNSELQLHDVEFTEAAVVDALQSGAGPRIQLAMSSNTGKIVWRLVDRRAVLLIQKHD